MPDIDMNKVVVQQKKDLLELCNFHAQLRDMRDSFKRTAMQLEDEFGIKIPDDEALIAVGSLIADLAVYVSEYKKEARGERQ